MNMAQAFEIPQPLKTAKAGAASVVVVHAGKGWASLRPAVSRSNGAENANRSSESSARRMWDGVDDSPDCAATVLTFFIAGLLLSLVLKARR